MGMMNMNNDAHEAGYQVYLDGVAEHKNPYDLREQEQDHLSWNTGWGAALEAEFDSNFDSVM